MEADTESNLVQNFVCVLLVDPVFYGTNTWLGEVLWLDLNDVCERDLL